MNTSTSILEKEILGCIIENPKLINELYIDDKCFLNERNRKLIKFLKKHYQEYKSFDLGRLVTEFPTTERQQDFINYWTELIDTSCLCSEFYSYQDTLQETYRKIQIDDLIKKYDNRKLDQTLLIKKIMEINNENLYLQQKNNKKTPTEMLQIIRDVDRNIAFNRFKTFNSRITIKQNTLNVIAARPSEGKSAFALNLLCDLSKKYKCLYFNMEMTEAEVYERMLGIESNVTIANIKKPNGEALENKVKETADRIYSYNYEIVNGSKSLNSLKSKIIREQRHEHLVVFIDYIGYVTIRHGMSDKDRIGEITRELNNLTKDYNCTIFLIAQINRNGSEKPTMNDLKDSGELEQSADTIILINDPNKQDANLIKDIELLIPKCRGSQRNIAIKIRYLKEKQRMEEI